MNVGLFGLVSQQFYAYWILGVWNCFTSLLPTMTVLVGFKDPLRLRWALPSCIIQPLTPLHRLFVVAQFVLVAFQSLLFVLTPYLGVKCTQFTRVVISRWHMAWKVL